MSAQSSPRLGQQPRKSALKSEDDPEKSPMGGAAKAVQIAEPEMSQLPSYSSSPEEVTKKQFTAGVAKRLSGRLPGNSSRSSLLSHGSLEGLNSTASSATSPYQAPDDAGRHSSQSQSQSQSQQQQTHHHHHHPHLHSQHHSQHAHHEDRAMQKLLSQVAEWLQRQKEKTDSRKKNKTTSRRKPKSPAGSVPGDTLVAGGAAAGRPRSGSFDSDASDVSLDRLQRIIDERMAALGLDSISDIARRPNRTPSGRVKRNRSSQQLYRHASSDTEYADGDALVPSCDAVLDNSKTMSYSGGRAQSSGPEDSTASLQQHHSKREEKERQAWILFKNEIIRLAHTLKLKGWRRVPLDSGDKIGVDRLSGALTNAVYVVSPPVEIPSSLATSPTTPASNISGTTLAATVAGAADPESMPSLLKKPPPSKVLLRIYGPNVEHLIDREKELSVLKRLSRRKIGPRLLGTFTNGRFEQYLNATALGPHNLREPETSKQIAKRMRELHDGIELLEQERNGGPNVWLNWDNWVDSVEKRAICLDSIILSGNAGPVRGPAEQWKTRGLVCGVEWPVFRALVEKYRGYLNEYYGDAGKIRDKLVFAHNDTQYGNILRVRPDDEKSPLLQPANEHKQLVVIDFEYAAANVPGLEFANHFTEWAYNYHDPAAPYACDVSKYPRLDHQRRFVRAYVDHRPHVVAAANTPSLQPTPSSSSVTEFMLDARAPPGGYSQAERRREEAAEAKVNELLEDTRLWRTANSAMWIAWGIVQAKVPELLKATDGGANGERGGDVSAAVEEASGGVTETTTVAAAPEASEEEAEFDYLGYAHERAMWFLGDCVLMGLVRLEDLPEVTRDKVKFVDR